MCLGTVATATMCVSRAAGSLRAKSLRTHVTLTSKLGARSARGPTGVRAWAGWGASCPRKPTAAVNQNTLTAEGPRARDRGPAGAAGQGGDCGSLAPSGIAQGNTAHDTAGGMARRGTHVSGAGWPPHPPEASLAQPRGVRTRARPEQRQAVHSQGTTRPPLHLQAGGVRPRPPVRGSGCRRGALTYALQPCAAGSSRFPEPHVPGRNPSPVCTGPSFSACGL